MPSHNRNTITPTPTPPNASNPSSLNRFPYKLQTLPQHIRIKNRRKRYLETHPSYFGPSLESAVPSTDIPEDQIIYQSTVRTLTSTDPLLYDRLVRSHQTAAERTLERASKGFAGTLEADLLRSEAKLVAVKARPRVSGPSIGDEEHSEASAQLDQEGRVMTRNRYRNGTEDRAGNGDVSTSASSLTPLPVPPDDYTSLTRDEAQQQWIDTMTSRFVRGEDRDFEYDAVDRDEGLDDVRGEERDREEEWFDAEEEGFLGGSSSEDGEAGEGKGKELKGETGVQDY